MSNLNTKRKVLVVGCGGLGCFVVEGLLRLNVKKIVVCDKDKFSKSNLNRQLYSSLKNIGKYKVDVALKRSKELGYENDFIAYKKDFEEYMLDDIDVAIDCLDNIKSRLYLEDCCGKRNIPLIHGAVEDSMFQVGVSMPNSNLLHNIYKNTKEPKIKKTNVITVEACASKQLSLALGKLEEYFEVCDI